MKAPTRQTIFQKLSRTSVSPYYLNKKLTIMDACFRQSAVVPRQLRREYPGAIHHLMNRGDHREDMVKDDEDRGRFLAALGQACQKTKWQVQDNRKDSASGRREFASQRERRRQEEESADHRQLRRGWWLGSEEFRQELLASAAERVSASHYGSDRREAAEAKARRIVVEELQRLGGEGKELRQRRKGDAAEVQVASTHKDQAQTVHGLERVRPELHDLAIMGFRLSQPRRPSAHIAQFVPRIGVSWNDLDNSSPLLLGAGQVTCDFEDETEAMMQPPVVRAPLHRLPIDGDGSIQTVPIGPLVEARQHSRPSFQQVVVVELVGKRRLMHASPHSLQDGMLIVVREGEALGAFRLRQHLTT